jgi:hypothetical protein
MFFYGSLLSKQSHFNSLYLFLWQYTVAYNNCPRSTFLVAVQLSKLGLKMYVFFKSGWLKNTALGNMIFMDDCSCQLPIKMGDF